MSVTGGNAKITLWHMRHVLCDCHEPSKWRECEHFALLRARGVGHTLYVVVKPLERGDYEFVPVDDFTGEQGGGIVIAPGYRTYPEALACAAAVVLTEDDWYGTGTPDEQMRQSSKVLQGLNHAVSWHLNLMARVYGKLRNP